MKYKVGDIVKIRSDLADFERLDDCYILPEMKRLAGGTFSIREVHKEYNNRYFLEKNKQCWSWTSEMFESVDAKISFNYLIL